MNSLLLVSVSGFAAYLTGSIPFAYIVGKARRIDIRTVGSGNVGATNVFRSVSKPLGVLTFFLDMSKGFIAAWLIPFMAKDCASGMNAQVLPVACAFCSIAGHNWTIFLKFKGGKGVATSAGALLGLAPLAVLICAISWSIVFIIFRYVSLGSIVAAIVISVCGWTLYRDQGLILPIALTLIGILAICRHKPNIIRLFNGSEHKFVSKKKSDPVNAGTPLSQQGDRRHEN
jgi:glycerol-3-phosphate acyltransferase PlsY